MKDNIKLILFRIKKHEYYCIFCGIAGVTLYFLCQNVVLTMTKASDISVIVLIFTIAGLFLSQVKVPRVCLKINKI